MKRIYWPGVLLVLGAVIIGGSVTLWPQRPPAAATADAGVATFLARHWRLPIPPQGPPPAHYTAVERSLQPQDCGLCHPQQWQDWKSSMHSRSMGPGVYGQLLDMDAGTATICATCHTPLSEQIPYLETRGSYEKNDAFDAALQQAGLVCAACHVRQHQRFGPPRRAELPALPAEAALPHGGFTASAAFQRAEFCKVCHQFTPDDFALNGKLIENTYEEWRQSPYAKEGIQCQHCHMPNRRHLWRGIHDVDMVKQALSVAITPNATSYRPGETMQAVITVTNTGAGHYLPTYVTPKIFVRAHLLDAQGQVIAGSAQQAVIGREVTLNLAEEVYDTRIPPHGSRAFTYAHTVPVSDVTLHVRVVVHPDHFYQRFFAAILQDGGGKGRTYLEAALRATEASPFTVFERDIPLAVRAAD